MGLTVKQVMKKLRRLPQDAVVVVVAPGASERTVVHPLFHEEQSVMTIGPITLSVDRVFYDEQMRYGDRRAVALIHLDEDP